VSDATVHDEAVAAVAGCCDRRPGRRAPISRPVPTMQPSTPTTYPS
jgi:hypothetical protein